MNKKRKRLSGALAILLLLALGLAALGEGSGNSGEVVEEELEDLFDVFQYDGPQEDLEDADEEFDMYGYATPIYGWMLGEVNIVAQDTFDGVTWCMVEDGTLILGHDEPQVFTEDAGRAEAEDYPWYAYRDRITGIVIYNVVEGADSLAHAFDGLDKLESITNRDFFDLSGVSDASTIFPKRELADVPFPEWLEGEGLSEND